MERICGAKNIMASEPHRKRNAGRPRKKCVDKKEF
jgi:hypothetical protein